MSWGWAVFERDWLPDAVTYFDREGLNLVGRGKWRTTECRFHGGSDSLRVNVENGAWVCMACAAKGGDVLAYHMQSHGLQFVNAARSLGAWSEKPMRPGTALRALRPTSFSPRMALEVLAFEATVAAVAACNVAEGQPLSDLDRTRLKVCANRINRVVQEFKP